MFVNLLGVTKLRQPKLLPAAGMENICCLMSHGELAPLAPEVAAPLKSSIGEAAEASLIRH